MDIVKADAIREIEPTASTTDGWIAVLAPFSLNKDTYRDLFAQGLSVYRRHDAETHQAIARDIQEVYRAALTFRNWDRFTGQTEARPLPFDDPARLLTVIGYAAGAVHEHEAIAYPYAHSVTDTHLRRFLWHYLRYAITGESLDPEIRHDVRVALGELVFGRTERDDYGPPAGTPVEGLETIGGRQCYKVPLAHSTPDCLARPIDTPDNTPQALVKDGYVYPPLNNAIDRYHVRYYNGRRNAFDTHLNAFRDLATDGSVATVESAVNTQNGFSPITKFTDGGRASEVVTPDDLPEPLETAVTKAVDYVDNSTARVNEPLSIDDIHAALAEYEDQIERDYIKARVDEIDSVEQLGQRLTDLASQTERITVISQDEHPNRYKIEHRQNDYKRINITQIEDVLEIPCFEALHEELQREDADFARWELYTFVRYLLELDAGITTDDIIDWFLEHYPWTDPSVTRYQVEYEARRTIGGNTPLPISCPIDRQNRWDEYCIGIDECPYSLWQSVDFKDRVYAQHDSTH